MRVEREERERTKELKGRARGWGRSLLPWESQAAMREIHAGCGRCTRVKGWEGLQTVAGKMNVRVALIMLADHEPARD